jgi:hypothetical protein
LGGGGFATTPGVLAGGVLAGGVLAGGGLVAGGGAGVDVSLLNCTIAPAPTAASIGAELRSLADAVSTPAIVQLTIRTIENNCRVFIDQLLVKLDVSAVAQEKSIVAYCGGCGNLTVV